MSSKTVNTYILLDRSGSMLGRWSEAFSSINTYVDELSKSKVKSLVTVALFDDYNGVRDLGARLAIERFVIAMKIRPRPLVQTSAYIRIGSR